MINLSYQNHLKSILTEGIVSFPRGKKTIERLGLQFQFEAMHPVLSMPIRKLGYKAMCAEAYWILSGSNLLSEIEPWMNMCSYSDNQIHLDGAYGPMFVDQVPYVIRTLKDDIYSRQAIISIWRDRPYQSKDIPCTLTVQFIVRAMHLHTIVNMRSSDAWLGLPYDSFTFSMMARYVATCLIDGNIFPGMVYINIGSAHIYEEHISRCQDMTKCKVDLPGPKVPWKFDTINDLFYFLKSHRDMAFREKNSNDLQKLMEEHYATKP